MDTRQYSCGTEFAGDVRLIFTNCYKYNPPDHDVVTMARKLQDVFEMKFAKIPDDPPDMSGSESDDGSGNSESDGESGADTDGSEAERARKLTELSSQLKQMQDQMKMLMEQSATKKASKKPKEKKKHRSGTKDELVLPATTFNPQGATSSMGPQSSVAVKPSKATKKTLLPPAATIAGGPPPGKKQKTGSRASKKKQANALGAPGAGMKFYMYIFHNA